MASLNVAKVFCINLDYCQDRWERMEARLQNVTPRMERFPAVSASDPRVFQQKLAGNTLSPGAIGCALSHLDVWKRIASSSKTDDLFLILEDDVFFQKDWISLLNEDLEHLKNFDDGNPFYYQLNGAGFVDFTVNESPGREGLFSISAQAGILYYTGGYLVNRAACTQLVEEFAASELLVASDHMTKWLQETAGGVWSESQCFFRYPWLAMQECRESFVQTDQHLETMRDFNENTYFPHYGHLYPEIHSLSAPEPEKRLTLVTMFYDLARREQNASRRQREAYLEYGDFVLGLPYNLVIFTEPDMEHYMWKHRKELAPTGVTLVVARPFDKLPFLNDEALVEQARENWQTATPVFPEKLTPEYSLMCCGRPALVAEVAEWNPFQSSHFGWIDFGCDHIAHLRDNFEKISISTPPHLPHHDKLWIPQKNNADDDFDLRFASTNLLDQVLGTFFCGTRRAVTTYAGVFAHALRHAIYQERLCPADEPVATWLTLLFPSLFQTYRTDWPTLLADACRSPLQVQRRGGGEREKSPESLQRDYEKFMTADAGADDDAIRELLWKILGKVVQCDLAPQEVLAVYVEGFTRMWYRFPQRRQEECYRVARHHLNFLTQDFQKQGAKGEHVELARKNADRLRYNWQFLQKSKQLMEGLKTIGI